MATRRKTERFPRLEALFHKAIKSGTSERIASWLEIAGSAEYIAFLVYLFDSQIGRGGFQFWILNGYRRYDAPLLALLGELKLRRGDELGRLIRKTETIAERAAELELQESPAADAALDRLAGRLAQMDEEYFALRGELLADLEKLLAPAPRGPRSRARTK